MSVISLKNGEYCGMIGIEITSIPDISIIVEKAKLNSYDEYEYFDKYRKEICALLSELYFDAKDNFNNNSLVQDRSIELMWYSTEAFNQVYKASVRLFLIFRIIDINSSTAVNSLDAMVKLASQTLLQLKYNFKIIDKEIEAIYSSLDLCSTSIMFRDDKIEKTYNPYISYVYSYEKIPRICGDLSKIVILLMEAPNTAISYQITPTFFSAEEKEYIEKNTYIMNTLNKGSMNEMFVNQKLIDLYNYYEGNKYSPLFMFNIVLIAKDNEIKQIQSKISGHINSEAQKVGLISYAIKEEESFLSENAYFLPWLFIDRVKKEKSNISFKDIMRRLSSVITGEEASELFRLPIGCKNIKAGINIEYGQKDIKMYKKRIINSTNIDMGIIKNSFDSEDRIGVPIDDLTKHMLVVGTPGNGKTTFIVGLIDQLWKNFNIPFLVIEPAKNEYRALIDSIPDIQVFTVGKDDISPYIINPFVPPDNVKIKSFKSALQTAFSAGVTMRPPLNKIFEESITNVYLRFNWLDNSTTKDNVKIFNIQDFAKEFEETFDKLGYVGEAKNIGKAGIVRLTSLVNLFDNYHSIPVQDILSKPTIIELAAIENDEQKALIIALLLLNILSYVNANYLGEGKLKNMLVLEEAHVLLSANNFSEQGESNPVAVAKSLLSRMLAEIRSYGVGMVIADQSPEKVTSDIIKLTNIKIGFNLVERTDKEIFANSTNLHISQIDRLTRLSTGDALFFTNGLEEPEEITVKNYRLLNKIRVTIPDDELRQRTTYWKNKLEKLRPYPECHFIKYCNASCDQERRMLAREYSRKIYLKYFNHNSTDVEKLKECYYSLATEVTGFLGKDRLSKPLLRCIQMHFLRRIKYTTKIRISDMAIKKTLIDKERKE